MKVAVVTAMPEQPGMSLAGDVELVRAAILYADELELVSTTIAFLSGLGRTMAGQPPMQVRPTSTAADREMLHDLIGRASGAELLHAAKAGLLSFAAYDKAFSSFNDPGGGDINSVMDNFMTEPIRKRLRNASTRLLFDGTMGWYANYLIDSGKIDANPLALRHSGEAAVGTGLIARLPAFPQAPIDELLDLRSDLGAPLTRYRAKVSQLAGTIATRSLDPEYPAEVDDLWRNHAAPALLELQEGFAEHGLIREIARTVGKDLKALISAATGAGVAVGLDTLASVDEWVSASAGVAAPAAQIMTSAVTSARDERRRLERHELFFLYEADRRL